MSSATVLPASAPPRKKVTIPSLMKKMKAGEAIVQMAVYDYRSAVVADRLGLDILCVSDTGGMVLFGHRSTVSVSFEEVMFMAQGVDRGSRYGPRMVNAIRRFMSRPSRRSRTPAGSRRQMPRMKCEAIATTCATSKPSSSGYSRPGHRYPHAYAVLVGLIAQGKTSERVLEPDDARQMVDADASRSCAR
jgi:3-methyl-2-oxobutanoate hydroxymethyltransferase